MKGVLPVVLKTRTGRMIDRALDADMFVEMLSYVLLASADVREISEAIDGALSFHEIANLIDELEEVQRVRIAVEG